MEKMRDTFFDFLRIILGVVLASIGLKAFLLLIFINVPLLVLAYIVVSRWVFWKSIFSILGLALFGHFETVDIITEDKLLIAIFGGLFLSLGTGVIRSRIGNLHDPSS